MNFENKVKLITQQLKQNVEKKYDVLDMKLFGSSARGDYSKSSDIDIMIQLSTVNRTIEEDLFDIAYDIELEHDCLIDIIVLSKDMDRDIPLLRTIDKEGISI